MANKFKQFLYDTIGIETKEDKEKVRQELLKNEGEIALMPEQAPTSDEKKEEKEKEWADVNQDYEYVCQGGTVMCKYHSAGDAKLMPTSTEVMLQDKPYVTEADTDGKTNFVFTGLCTHSSHGSKKPPCKAVINLSKWKNCSTSHIDDYHPILFKSSIPCMISGEDLKITNSGQVNRPEDLSICPSKIKVHIKKVDTEYFTPLGIQNPIKKDIETEGSIKLVYEISGEDAIRVDISVADKNGDAIFLEGILPNVVVTGSKSKIASSDTTTDKIDYEIEEYIPSELLKQGTHVWTWDGFDIERKLDTTRLLGKLTFEARAYSQNGLTIATSTYTVKTEPILPRIRWVKALITNTDSAKDIDLTIHVNLKDGGAKGLKDGYTEHLAGMAGYQEVYIPADWEKVPEKERIKIGEEPIKTRVTSFEDLVNLALDGVKTYWSRNGTRDNGITVDGVNFKVNTEAINTDKKSPYSLDDIPLIFNTNGEWGRSGNPGCWGGLVSTATKAIDSALNLFDIHIQQITYNVGYIKDMYTDVEWVFEDIKDANSEFQETTAHELGHEILQTFGGDSYSYRHKESTNLAQQKKKYRTTNAPSTGEQDLMKYYYGSYGQGRIVAAEGDVKGLIWLTSIKLEQ